MIEGYGDLSKLDSYLRETGINRPRAVYLRDEEHVENANDRYSRYFFSVFPLAALDALIQNNGGVRNIKGAFVRTLRGSEDTIPVSSVDVTPREYEIGLRLDGPRPEFSIRLANQPIRHHDGYQEFMGRDPKIRIEGMEELGIPRRMIDGYGGEKPIVAYVGEDDTFETSAGEFRRRNVIIFPRSKLDEFMENGSKTGENSHTKGVVINELERIGEEPIQSSMNVRQCQVTIRINHRLKGNLLEIN